MSKPIEIIEIYATRRVGFENVKDEHGNWKQKPVYAPVSLSDPIFRIMQVTAIDGRVQIRAKGRRNIEMLQRILEVLNPQMKSKFDSIVLKNVGSDERLFYETNVLIEQDIKIPERIIKMKEKEDSDAAEALKTD